jgi:DNA-directed RNA polymerase subunit RPC12/RpoP
MLFMFIIINMKEFECKGCGTSICIPEIKDKDPMCPECRGAMLLLGNSRKQVGQKKFACSECGAVFFMSRDKEPYKCPFCNYTFSISPGLKQEERL